MNHNHEEVLKSVKIIGSYIEQFSNPSAVAEMMASKGNLSKEETVKLKGLAESGILSDIAKENPNAGKDKIEELVKSILDA